MPHLFRRCVYTLHSVAASIAGRLHLLGVWAAALAIVAFRRPKGLAAVLAAPILSPRHSSAAEVVRA